MPKISLQFYGLEKEWLEAFSDSKNRFAFKVTVLRASPFRAALLRDDRDIQSQIKDFGNYDRLVFSITEPDLKSRNWNDFILRNPDDLFFEPGRISEKGLKESFLAARANCDISLKVWRKIQRGIRNITHAGAWVKNPKTGVKFFYKSIRYTDGALLAFREGVVILPTAGWNIVEFEQKIK
jgi:hypothetical protein